MGTYESQTNPSKCLGRPKIFRESNHLNNSEGHVCESLRDLADRDKARMGTDGFELVTA